MGLIRELLLRHNEAEERADGLYAVCDDLLTAETEDLLVQLAAFPRIPLAPHQDGPNVHRHIEQALELSRRAWAQSAGPISKKAR